MSTLIKDNVVVTGSLGFSAGFGDQITFKSATTTITGMSGATATASNFIPAGALVLGVFLKVTTLITMGAGTTFTVGDGTTADRWGSGIALALGTTTTFANFKAATSLLQAYASATSVVLTGTGGSFTAGAVRLTMVYMDSTAIVSS